MTSTNRLAANRRNAQRSTGPRSERGKARSSRNALRHGLCARRVVLLPCEDPKDLKEFRASLMASLAPCGAVQELWAQRIVANAWRLRRASSIESGLFSIGEAIENGDAAALATKFLRLRSGLEAVGRYETGLERSLIRACRELERLQEAGRRNQDAIVDAEFQVVDERKPEDTGNS